MLLISSDTMAQRLQPILLILVLVLAFGVLKFLVWSRKAEETSCVERKERALPQHSGVKADSKVSELLTGITKDLADAKKDSDSQEAQDHLRIALAHLKDIMELLNIPEPEYILEDKDERTTS